jgi:hypothetical protein
MNSYLGGVSLFTYFSEFSVFLISFPENIVFSISWKFFITGCIFLVIVGLIKLLFMYAFEWRYALEVGSAPEFCLLCFFPLAYILSSLSWFKNLNSFKLIEFLSWPKTGLFIGVLFYWFKVGFAGFLGVISCWWNEWLFSKAVLDFYSFLLLERS